MKIEKIKLIRIPYFTCVRYPDEWSGMKCEYFPPLALGVITGYLRSKGIELEQDDLQLKVHYDNFHRTDQTTFLDGEIFFDKEKVLSYLMGNNDPELEKAAEIILEKTQLKDFDLILLSAPRPVDITPLLSTLVIAKKIKKKYKVPIAIGGCGTPDEWLLALRLKIVDFVISGPGEIALEKLINALRNDKPISHIPGLNYLKDGKILFSDQDAPSTLSELDFDDLPLEKYRWKNSIPGKIVPRQNSSSPDNLVLPFNPVIGCPFYCAYCPYVNKKLSFLEPKIAVDHLRKLAERYGTRYFFFLHPTVNFSQNYINEFCDRIIEQKLNISWSSSANFRNLNEEILSKMRKAGAIALVWGLESGSQRLLDYINKGITIEKAVEMLKISHQLGIWNGVNLITGLPHEQEDDIQMTIDLINRHRELVDTLYLNPFYLDDRSRIYKWPRRYGIENIRRIDIYTYGQGDGISDIFAVTCAFDEVNGLKWEKKIAQIDSSLRKMREELGEDFWTNESLPLLLHLYSIFGSNKERIKRIYHQWTNYQVEQIGHRPYSQCPGKNRFVRVTVPK